MAGKKNVFKDLEKRLEAIEDILSEAAIGELDDELEITEDDSLSSVEYGINLMLQDIREMIEEDRKKAEMIRAKNEEMLRVQDAALKELSTPIIKIWDGVLTLPVIGVVDSRRSEEMMELLLENVVETQSRCVIIDITGVNVVDTKTADHFLKMVKAIKLLGAECIITGTSPEIAQTLTNIGVDLTQIKTLRNLQDGLREAFKLTDIKIVSQNGK